MKKEELAGLLRKWCRQQGIQEQKCPSDEALIAAVSVRRLTPENLALAIKESKTLSHFFNITDELSQEQEEHVGFQAWELELAKKRPLQGAREGESPNNTGQEVPWKEEL